MDALASKLTRARRLRYAAWPPLALASILGACADLAGIERGFLQQGGAVSVAAGGGGNGGSWSAQGGAPAPLGGNHHAQGGEPQAGGAANGGAPAEGGDAGAGEAGSRIPPQGGHSAGGSIGSGGASNPGSGGASGGKSSGGAGGTSGGTSGGTTQLCQDGFCTRCPIDSALVEVGSFSYCVQTREVTNAEYLSFVQQRAAAWPVGRQPASCSFNVTYQPDPGCDGDLLDSVSADRPVRCVDWCDAHTYCRSVGLHLCGRMGGTPNRLSDVADVEADEWFAACTGPDQTDYPYGEEFEGSTCNGSEFAPSDAGPKAASKLKTCEGGFTGLLNMSGNVAEWNDSCEAATGSSDRCATRGGSYQDGPYELRCAGSNTLARDTQAEHVGFRCCAELIAQ